MIACLLPARNAEAEIAGWLESATGFADVIVALDDGSTDRTAELLRAAPAVAKVLSNESGPGTATGTMAPTGSASLPRRANSSPIGSSFSTPTSESSRRRRGAQGLPGGRRDPALRLRLHHVRRGRPGNGRASAEDGLPSVRLAAGTRAAGPRFHFNPVPVSIPDEAYVPTTIRARHLASPERQSLRSEKYREADPAGDWGRDRPGPAPASK